MDRTRSFKVGTDIYDIPESKAQEFLNSVKDKSVEEILTFDVDKDKYDIPVQKVKIFLQSTPFAKPSYDYPALDTLVTEKSKFDQYNKSQSRVTPQSDTFRSQTIDPNAVAYKQENKEDYDTLPTDFGTGWKSGVENLKGGIKYLGGVVGETIDKLDGEDEMQWDNRLMESARKNFENAPRGKGIWYEFGTFAPQMIGIAAATATAPLTAGTSLAVIPGVIGGGNIAMLVGSASGSAMYEYDRYMDEKGEKSNSLARLGVGIGSGAAEYLAERIGLDRYMPKGSMARAFSKFLSKNTDVAEKIGKEVVQKAPLLREFGKKTIKNAVEEGSEEVITEIGNIAIESIYRDKDDIASAEEIVSRLGSAFKGGAMMGGVISPLTFAADRAYQAKMGKNDQPQVPTVPPNSPQGGIDPEVQAVIDRERGIYEGLLNEQDNDQNKPMYQERLDQLNNDPLGYFTLALQKKELLNKSNPSESRQKQIEELKGIISKLQPANAAPADPMQQVKTEAEQDFDSHIHKESGNNIFVNHAKLGPIRLSMADIDQAGNITSETGEVFAWDPNSPGNQIPIPLNEIIGKPVIVSRDQYLQDATMKAQTAQAEEVAVESNSYTDETGQRWMTTGQQDEKGNPLVAMVDGNNRATAQIKPVTPEQLEGYMQKKQVEETPVPEGEAKPVVKNATWGKTQYQYKSNPDGTADVLIPNKVPAAKAFDEISKHFANNTRFTVVPVKEKKLITDPNDEFADPVEQEVTIGVKIVPKEMAPATPDHAQPEGKGAKTTAQPQQKQVQASYTFGKDKIDRDEAVEIVNLAENYEDIKDLKLEGDAELDNLVKTKFPPAYTIAGQPATPAIVKANIRLGKNLDQITVQNDSELSNLLSVAQKKFTGSVNKFSQPAQKVNQNENKKPLNSSGSESLTPEELAENSPNGALLNAEIEKRRAEDPDYDNKMINSFLDEINTFNNLSTAQKKRYNLNGLNARLGAHGLSIRNVQGYYNVYQLIGPDSGPISRKRELQSTKQERKEHPLLTQYDEKTQGYAQQLFNLPDQIWQLLELPKVPMNIASIRAGIRDIKEGKRSNAANNLLDNIEQIVKKNSVTYKPQYGQSFPDQSIDEMLDFYLSDNELNDEEIEKANQIPEDIADAILTWQALTDEQYEALYSIDQWWGDSTGINENKDEDEQGADQQNDEPGEEAGGSENPEAKGEGIEEPDRAQPKVSDEVSKAFDKDLASKRDKLSAINKRIAEKKKEFETRAKNSQKDIFPKPGLQEGEIETPIDLTKENIDRIMNPMYAERDALSKDIDNLASNRDQIIQKEREKKASVEKAQQSLFGQEPAQPTFELVKKRVIDHFGGMYEDVVKSSPEYIYENIPEATPEIAKKVYDTIKTEYEAEQKKQKENQDKPVFGWEVAHEAANVNQNPSPAQKEAGNYKKGHVTIQGMDISIENPTGSKRSGTDPDGNKWERTMTAHYGYFKRTNGKDGDQIDTFINPDNPESDVVFVVDQDKPGKEEFDESKVMLGYKSYQEAKEAYLSNYEDGWVNNVRAITEVPLDKFKRWLYDGARQRKPFGEYKDTPAPVQEQQAPEKKNPYSKTLSSYANGLISLEEAKDYTNTALAGLTSGRGFNQSYEDYLAQNPQAKKRNDELETIKAFLATNPTREQVQEYIGEKPERTPEVVTPLENAVNGEVVKKNLTTEKEPWEMTRDEFIQEKELKQAESNKLDTPTENIYKVGDRYIEFGNDPYVFELRNVNPNDIDYSEKWQSEEAVLGRDDVQQYIKWFKEGKQPMPISIVFNKDRKEYISSNRRRLLAARNSGVKTIPAWVEVGKHRDLIQQALSEGKPVPENVLKDYPELKKQEPDIDNAIKVAKSQNEINWDNKPEQEPAKPEADENNVFDEDHVSRNLDDYKNEPEKEKALKFIKSNLFDAIGEKDLLGSTPERVKRIANLTELIKRIEGLRESPKEYRYKMTLRPFGIATHPKDGFVKADQDPKGGFEILTYNRKLNRNEWENFSLIPLTDIDEVKEKQYEHQDGDYTVDLEWLNNNKWATVTIMDKNGEVMTDPYDMSYMDILENIETGYWVENKKSNNSVQNGNNEVPESVPQRERRTQDEESGGMAKESGSRIGGLQATIRDARKDSEGLSDREITDKVEKPSKTINGFESDPLRENIEKELLQKLEDRGYRATFYDNNANEVTVDKATELQIGFTTDGETYIGKSIKLPKTKRVDLDYVLTQLEKDNTYKSFADKFSEALRKIGYSSGVNVYPATYGIGVFVWFDYKGSSEKIKADVKKILDDAGIKYETEYSDARMVYRYKISKAAENIERLNTFNGNKPQRFDEGKKLTEVEKREVYRTLKDAYKVNNRPRTLEDQGQGERWLWLENASDYMVTSDITGAKLRWFVTLPDGKIAHPTELWPSMDRAEIERVQDSIERQGYYADKKYNETLTELKKNREVESVWDNIDRALKAGAEFVKEYSAEDRGQRDPNVYLRWKHLPGNTPIPDYHLRMEGSTFAGMNQAQYIKAKETGNKWTRWENANIDWERFYNENKPLQTPLEKAISQNPVLKLESPESIEKLEDFGDKIGGARKDIGIIRTGRDTDSMPSWRRKYSYANADGTIVIGGKVDTSKPFRVVWEREVNGWGGKSKQYYPVKNITSRETILFNSEEEAEAYIPIYEVSQQRFRIRKGENGFNIVRASSTGKVVEYATFPTEEEANAYMYSTEGATSLLNHRREDFSIPKLDKVERNGKDWRKGKDVTTDEFMNTFGFRGGEFGNWVKPEERRVMLNASYDSFMDLSELLNIPPRAVSLGGELAIAFGARGIKGAAAHFEPDRAVINMTRMNGAGSLAHEWAHAMDSYFGMQEAKSSYEKNEKGQLVNGGKFLSEDKTYKAGMRKELSKIFDEIVSATQSKSVTRVMGVEEKQKLFDLNSKLVNEESNHIIKKFEKGIIRYLYNRKTKQREETLVKATPEQLEKVKEIVDKIRNGEGTAPDWNRIPGSKGMGEYSYISPETLALEELHKEVFGKSGLKRDGNGFFNLGYYANKMYPAKKAFEKAKAGETETVNVKTDYLKNSIEFDASRSGPYFQKKVEMFARAFEYFIEQKLLDKNQRADYLQYDKAPVYEAIYGMSPYPAGEELAELNKLFQKFFDEVKVVDKGGVSFMQRVVSTIGYYSTVEDALDKITQGKGTPEQFKAMLLKNGAKQAEMDWMDFDGSFADKKSVTKADIQNWIDENKIEVEEVEKGSEQFPITKDDVESVEQNEDGEWVVTFKEEAFGESIQPDAATAQEAINNAILELRDSGMLDEGKPEDRTKYSQYTTPGGENYKELLLTMPDLQKQNRLDYNGRFIELQKEVLQRLGDKVKYPAAFNLYDAKHDGLLTQEELSRLNSIDQQANKKLPENFKSSHFDEPNILAHVRFDERVTPDGEKVLFIEEIQSDWAQKGKKEGFGIKKKQKTNAQINLDNYTESLNEKYGNEWDSEIISEEDYSELSRLNELANESVDYDMDKTTGVPDMPFKNTDQWVNLSLRRMMRFAAEHGFDRIAWTTGEQQAERYDLSKQVDAIRYDKGSNGTYEIRADKNGREVLRRNGVGENELEEIVGKDIAQKIINGEGKEPSQGNYHKVLSGVDLKVGGEGMKAFYDKIIPSAASKLGKPFGAKLEPVTITGSASYEELVKAGEQTGLTQEELDKLPIDERVKLVNSKLPTVQSIPVTESMKETAMNGVPLFSVVNHKKQQFEVIQSANPAQDDIHTWIRDINEIQTLEEAIKSPEWNSYEEYNPDWTAKNANKAIRTGKVTVYSSKPIEAGTFVTPSKMEAQSYSGDGKVYSQEVNTSDVAWIDPTQGQYAPVSDNVVRVDDVETVRKAIQDLQNKAANAKPLFMYSSEKEFKEQLASARIPEEAANEVLSDGKTIGFYDEGRGIVFIDLRKVGSVREGIATWVHEMGLHAGLRNIIPAEQFDSFMEEVYDLFEKNSKGYDEKTADNASRTAKKAYDLVMGSSSYNEVSKAKKGEEMMAYFGERYSQSTERGDTNLEDKGIFKQIVEKITNLLRKVFGLTKRELTLDDVELIVKGSIRSMFATGTRPVDAINQAPSMGKLRPDGKVEYTFTPLERAINKAVETKNTGNNGNFDPDDFNILRRTTQEGEKQLSLFDEPKTLPDGEGETYTTKKGEKIRYRSLSPDNWPVSGKIREKKDYIPGDDDIFCAIEREITESKIVELTGTDKIESPADVAYLFRHLESAASENAFVVHHLKGGGYVVQYISSGSTSGTVVDSKLIVAAAKEFGSAAITFVHNHPSGNLQASDADKKMHAMLRKACEGVCEMNPSVIIDLDRGEYGVFEEYWNVSEKTENDRKTASVKVPVYSFDKQVLYEKSDTWTQITGSDSVAKYLSKIKRGTGKYIVIIMNRNNRITRTFLSTTFPRKEDIIPMVGKHGDSVIIASPIKESDRVMSLSKSMEDTGVKLIDWIEIESDPGIIKSYKSAADEGLIRDPNTVYGYQPTEFEVNDPTPLIVTPFENVVQNAADRYAEKRAINRTWNETRDQMKQFWKDIDLPIKRLQEAIVSLGGKLTDNSQPYRAIDLAKGRMESLYTRYLTNKFNPILKAISDMRKIGISGLDILPYMICKHTLERNPDLRNKELNELVDKFKKSNPDATQDEIDVFTFDAIESLKNKDYSGVMPFDKDENGKSINGFENPEELAQSIVDEFEARFDTDKKKALLKALWDANHKAGQETLKIWNEGNSMSKEEYEYQQARYKHFVPLRGWREGPANQLMYHKGQGFGKSLVHAEGRTSLAENPLAYMKSVAFKALGEQVDNEVRREMLNLLLDNWKVKGVQKLVRQKQAYYIKVYDAMGNWEWDIARDADGELVKPDQSLIDAGEAKAKVYSNHEKLRTSAQAKEHEVWVRTANMDVVLVFDNKSKDMLEVAHAFNHSNTMFKYMFSKNVGDAESWNKPLASTIGIFNNWQKAMYTSFNVVFPFTNFGRDIQEATLTQWIKGESGTKVVKNYKNAFPAIIRAIRGEQDLKNNDFDKLYERFYLTGGITGFTHSKDIQQIEREVDRIVEDLTNKGTLKGAVGRNLRHLVGNVETWNRIFEDATRFSVFMAAVEAGKTDKEAASLAKEASVNFNRKGKITKSFDSVWAFFNVSLESMFKNFGLAHNFPKRFWTVAGGYAAAGFIITLINDMLPGDDDDDYYNVSDYARRNYLILPNIIRLIAKGEKGDKYLRLPLPQFWRGFFSAGSLLYDVAVKGDVKATKAVGIGLSNFIAGLLPVDITGVFSEEGVSFSPIAPTVTKPVIEMLENRNFMGQRIYNEPFTLAQKDELAGAGLGKSNVNQAIKFITDLAFVAGGGEKGIYRKMKVDDEGMKRVPWIADWNPSKIEHILKGYTGGTGGVITDAVTTAVQIFDPNTPYDFRNTPFINAFIRKVPEKKWKTIREYQEVKSEISDFPSILRAYKSDARLSGDTERYKTAYKNRYLQEYSATIKVYDNVISNLAERVDYKTGEGMDEMVKVMNDAINKVNAIKEKYDK